jgi:hypothetical protein
LERRKDKRQTEKRKKHMAKSKWQKANGKKQTVKSKKQPRGCLLLCGADTFGIDYLPALVFE